MTLPNVSASDFALGIADVCKRTGLGRTTIFAAIRSGQLTARKVGRRTIILSSDLAGFLQALPRVIGEGSPDES